MLTLDVRFAAKILKRRMCMTHLKRVESASVTSFTNSRKQGTGKDERESCGY